MKKVDRQPDHKPGEPYAGEHNRSKTDSPRKTKAPRPAERKPDERIPEPAPRYGGQGDLEDERSDRHTSGRPLQLKDEEARFPPGRTNAEPGFGGREEGERSSEGRPFKR